MPKQTPLPGGYYYYADGETRRESWNQIIAERQHDRWMENRNNLYQVAADLYDSVTLDADGQGQFVMSLEEIVATFFGYHPDAPATEGLNLSYSDEFNRSWFDKWSFVTSYWGAAANTKIRDSWGFTNFLDNTDDFFSINQFPRNMLVFKYGNNSALDTFQGFAPTTSAFVVATKISIGGEAGGGTADLYLADSTGGWVTHGNITVQNVDQGPWYIVFARAEGETEYHIFTSTDGKAFWYEGSETKAGTIEQFGLRLTSQASKRIWAVLSFVRVFLGTQKIHTGGNLKTT